MQPSQRDKLTVLGIDPGTQATGYALVQEHNDSQALLSYGVITPSRKLPHAEKLLQIHTDLTAIIESQSPTEVVLEDFVFGNRQAAVAIGEARAVTILAAAQAGLPVFLYKPAEIKQAVSGYGRASKEQVQEMIRLHLRLDETPESADASDAVAIALGHIFKRNAQKTIEARMML